MKNQKNYVTWDQIGNGFFWLTVASAVITAVYIICSCIIKTKIEDVKRSSYTSGYYDGVEDGKSSYTSGYHNGLEDGIISGCRDAYYQPDSKVNFALCTLKAER